MNTNTRITAYLVSDADRANFVHGLFGLHFPMVLEPTVFTMADMLAKDYSGGLWAFHALGNGDFYMAPEGNPQFAVVSENGFCQHAWRHRGVWHRAGWLD